MAVMIFGTKVKVEFSFLLVICLSLLLDYKQILFLLLFSSLHELGHLSVLYLLGGRAEELTLSYYGIGLKPLYNFSAGKEVVFLLGGAAVNIIFAAFAIQRELNIALAAINLLPVYPLDGGRALGIIVNAFSDYAVSVRILQIISVIIISLLIIIAIVLKNISLLLISVYIIFYSINNRGMYD